MFDPTISARAMEIQRETAEVLGWFGEGCAGQTLNESDESFQRRTLAALQRHSPNFQFSNFDNQSAAYLPDSRKLVIADVRADFERPVGKLRPRVETDGANRKIKKWFGNPLEWMSEFSDPPRYANAVALDQLGKRSMSGLVRE
jgi:hypothetical protein